MAVKFTVPVMFRLDDDKLEKTSSANGITVEGYAGNGKEPLYIVDGKILSTRSKGKDTYYLPGGSADLCRFERKRIINLKYPLT